MTTTLETEALMRQTTLCLIALVILGIATHSLFVQSAEAFGICCSFGYECSASSKCCRPSEIGALNCSDAQKGYCIDTESCLTVEE